MALKNRDCPSTKVTVLGSMMITCKTLQALSIYATQKQTSASVYATVMPFQLMKVPPTIGT